MSLSRLQKMTAALKRARRYLSCEKTAILDLSKPLTGDFEKSVVFISVDCEADEQGRLTEVGIAVLDTNEIRKCAPGTNGKQWMKHVRATHYRVLDKKQTLGDWKCKNKWSGGDPSAFVLGVTEEKSMEQMASIIRAAFEEPFTKMGGLGIGKTKRELVFVAHNMQADLNYLSQLNFDPRNHPKVIDLIDTQDLEQAVRREPFNSQPRKLEKVITGVGERFQGAHNAGMDAFYTLFAVVALVLASKLADAHVMSGALDENTSMSSLEGDHLVFDDKWHTNCNGGEGIVSKKSMADFMAYYAGKK